MRLVSLLVSAAAFGALACGQAALSAQSTTEETIAPAPGLSDLGEALEGLADEPQPAQAEAPSAEPAPAVAEPAPAPSVRPSAPAPRLTRAETQALARTIERGKLLIDLAGAGLIATRDMLTRISDPEGAGIAGWIAEPQGNAVGVTFYAAGSDAPRTVYRVNVNGGRIVSRDVFLSGEGPVFNPVQARMAAARAATEALDHQSCSSQPFNVLVIPPSSASEPIDVYQISAPAAQGRFPLGGHFRASVAADGSIADTRAFAKGCTMLEVKAQAQGRAPEPIGVVHLLDNRPTEIHMFLSKQAGSPLLVATGEPQRIWLVTGERIAEVRP